MGKIIRKKFSFDNPEMMDEGVKVVVEAYRKMKQANFNKIDAMKWARRGRKYLKMMPDSTSMVEYLSIIEELLETGENIGAKNKRNAKDAIINTATDQLRAIGYGKQVNQLKMELETDKEEDKPEVEQIQEEKESEKVENSISTLINEIIKVIRNGVTITIRPISDNK